MSQKATTLFDRVLTGSQSYRARTCEQQPDFFKTLAAGQKPELLWIGCADSRVPETTVCDCKPGDIFVHRNIANVVSPNDLSANSVLDYSVGVLKVNGIVVCGHTKCGGAAASLGDEDLGETLNTWLAPVREMRKKHQEELDQLASDDERAARLAGLNVQRSLETLRQNKTVIKAMEERDLKLYGVIYDLADGELRVLERE
ncbi:hypothetical protein W97_08344 [Coniosporium apollinis CBS 100218]|uniref:Carbonic anhydrase n=1 Tax=Coniosporium apollinis (strain CBS 100218) TaxID=1168221 RepID=R7Z524_CONA1|nr:uncharacterized protein W97_08344 [Coniosporium apollinis CBS 100218]EON69031.1 hypothetical protein W97_08344 [Coniosporium apollinis CBS 100218]